MLRFPVDVPNRQHLDIYTDCFDTSVLKLQPMALEFPFNCKTEHFLVSPERFHLFSLANLNLESAGLFNYFKKKSTKGKLNRTKLIN